MKKVIVLFIVLLHNAINKIRKWISIFNNERLINDSLLCLKNSINFKTKTMFVLSPTARKLFYSILLVFFIFAMKSQLSSIPSTMQLYQAGKLYFKIRTSSSARILYPTIQNDSASTLASLFTTYSVTNVETPYKILDSAKFWKTYRVTFTDTSNIASFISGLQALTNVEYAEKVPQIHMQTVPNDPVYPYHLSLINANAASSIHTSTGTAVVAIVDDAVLTTHQDLAANMSATNRDVADLDNNCDPPFTGPVAVNGIVFTHGTHVAGIAGAVTNNSIGIASIGWNNKIMGVKARKDNAIPNTLPYAFDGVTWAAANGANVINMSWGSYVYSQTEYSVIAVAKSLNVVLVGAAGNDNTTSPFYPAAYGEGLTGQSWEALNKNMVVAVAGLDPNNDIADFGAGSSRSNHGSWVDISAYALSIYSTLASSSVGSAINNVYGNLSGTSMAAPMVAGAAGIMKSYNVSKTSDDIINCLVYTANPDIYNSGVHPNNFPGTLGIGRLDVAAALKCLVPSCTNPIAVIVPSSTKLCPSSSVTLTANSATSYTWSTGANTQSISVGTAGTYTLSINIGTCVATQTIGIQNTNTVVTIKTYENSSWTKDDGIVCGNAYFSIICYSGLSYTWSPAWTNAQTLSNTMGFTTSGGTAAISVTVAGVGGCSGINGSASTTIQAFPLPNVVITPTAASAYWGCAATLTASGATSYSWAPVGQVSCSNCAVTNAYPSPPWTTFTVTGTDGNNCSMGVALQVNAITDNNCYGTVPTVSVTSSGSFTSASIEVLDHNMYINSGASYTIACSDFRIWGNVLINVANNATLTIDGSWLHSCTSCNTGMWQGIVVQPGGTLNIKNYSIIEDALIAVNTPSNTSSTPVSKWQISQTIFNKNGSHIYANMSSEDMSASYIYNSILTCREFTSHAIGSTNFSNIRSSILAATPSSPGSNTLAVTLAGTRTSNGIYLDRVSGGTVSIGSSSQSSNVFDNLDFGVYSYASPLIVKNNNFQNMVGCNGFGVGVMVSGGGRDDSAPRVIIGNGTNTVVANEGNSFTNCLYGIEIERCQNVAINNNTFTCESTSTIFTTGNQIGQYGVINTLYAARSATNNANESLTFCNNKITNYATGYYFDFGKLYNTAGLNQYFSSNTITATGTSTAYCNQGIYMQQSNSFGAYTGVPWNSVVVTSNSITNAAINAIALNAIGTSSISFVNINSNTELSVKYNSSATSSVSPHIAAVYLSGCNKISVNNNTKIQCTGLTSYSTTNAQYIAGIYIAASPNSTINCNTVKYVGEGFVWEGSSAGSNWFKNNTQNSRYALVLRNTGIMGDQGATSAPIGDIFGKYVSTNISDAHTLADNSDPSLSGFTSKLYVISGSCSTATTYSPCQHTNMSGTSYAAGSSLFTTTGSFPCVCTGDCGSGRLIGYMSVADSLAAVRDSMLMKIVRGIEANTPLPSYDPETRWASQYYVSSENSTLPSAAGYNNVKTFAIIDGAIASDNYLLAQNLLNALSPSNIIEQNWRAVNNIIIKVQSDTLNNSDISNLKAVAEQCPLTGGSIVYKARAILNSYYKTIAEYKDKCNSNSNKLMSSGKTYDQNQIVTVYPNPNNGAMTFAYSLTENGLLEITDVKGIVVEKHSLSAASNQMQLQSNSLIEGIYFYRVIGASNNIIKTGKIIIIK